MDQVEEKGRGRDTSAHLMGWIGVIAGIISFFYAPVLFGGIAIVLGLITVFSRANSLGWWAIVLGIVGSVLNMIYHGIRWW